MPRFDTHTGLTIIKGVDDTHKVWSVVIFSEHEPEREKTLYSGPDETAAQREFAKWVKHYEERAEVEKSAS